MKLLLNYSADPNWRASVDAWTPLMLGVSSGNIAVVKCLIEANAEFRAQTSWGDTALTIAAQSGQEEIATYLADIGAVLPANAAGRRASTIASRRGLDQLVRRLTGDYQAVAKLPLQRQTTRLNIVSLSIQEDGHGPGLPIREATTAVRNEQPATELHAQESEVSQPTEQASDVETSNFDPSNNEEDFLEAIDGVPNTFGFLNRFELLEKLGGDSFATVHRCKSKITKVAYAVKVIPARHWKIWRCEFAAILQMREKRAFHPHILGIIDVFAEYSTKSIYTIQELAYGGELFSYLVEKKSLSEQACRIIFTQLFSAVDFLVSVQILPSLPTVSDQFIESEHDTD